MPTTRRAVREAFAAHSGYEVDDAGDGLFYAFSSASGAVSAVTQAMASLADGPVRIRVGVHTGEPVLDPPKYVGADVLGLCTWEERSRGRFSSSNGTSSSHAASGTRRS